jgi:hypothetical protein
VEAAFGREGVEESRDIRRRIDGGNDEVKTSAEFV